MGAIRPAVSSVVQPIAQAIYAARIGGGPAPFDPASLYAHGEQGAFYDSSDFSTMFQDAAGTTPVTAVGQPVGLIRDKSPNHNDASQATSTKRPLIQVDGNGKYYLQFDGVDDYLLTASISFTANMFYIMGASRTGNCLCSGAPANTTGPFILAVDGTSLASSLSSGTPSNYVNGVATTDQNRNTLGSAWPVNTVSVVECQSLTLTSWTRILLGLQSNFASFNGISRVYPMVVVATPSAGDIARSRTWVGGKCGVTL